MKTIIGVIFLVFAILIGFSYMDKYFYPDTTNSQATSESSSSSDSTSEKVCVTLSGEVNKKGKYYATEGSFLNDFIELAGGVTANADTSCYDLYLEVNEDIEIYIPPIGDEIKISINDGSIDDLDSLDGIGPKIALRIITYRSDNGSFTYLEQLMEVDGIGTTLFNKVKDHICL